MLTRLILTDFMAHGQSLIDLGPGVTVLSGRNNTGKSAVVEALRCLAENPAVGRHFIRHGAKAARVEAVFDDGRRVAWVRKPNTSFYQVKGSAEAQWEEFHKLGQGGVPDEVRDILGMDRVDLDGTRVDVHLGDQKRPIFLLEESDSDKARFFAASSEASHLLAMQKALGRKVRDAGSRAATLGREIRLTERELERMAPLPGLELSLQRAQATRHDLDALDREIPALDGLARNLGRARRGRKHKGAISLVLAGMQAPPSLWPARDLAATLARQDRLSRGIRVKEASLALHQRLAPPPDIADTPDLARTLARLTGLRHNLDRKELEAGVLENLEPPSKPYPAGELYRDLGRLAASRLGVQSRSARCEVLSRLREPPAVTDTSALEALLAGFSGLGRRLAEAKQDEARVGRRMEELGADITRRLEDIGRCPLCGGELDPERFLAQGEGCGHG